MSSMLTTQPPLKLFLAACACESETGLLVYLLDAH